MENVSNKVLIEKALLKKVTARLALDSYLKLSEAQKAERDGYDIKAATMRSEAKNLDDLRAAVNDSMEKGA